MLKKKKIWNENKSFKDFQIEKLVKSIQIIP